MHPFQVEGRAGSGYEDVAPLYKRPTSRIWHLRRDLTPLLGNLLPARKVKRFCIITTFRTGSELLVGLLDEHSAIKCDSEIITPRPAFPFLCARGRARIAGLRGFEAYGFKLLSTQLMDVFPSRDTRFVRHLRDDGFVFIHLRRRNLLQQVVSHERAVGSGTWHHWNKEPHASAIEVDVPSLIFWMRFIEVHDQVMAEMTHDCSRFELFYEDHLQDAEAHQGTVDLIASRLGLGVAPVKARMTKIAPRLASSIRNLDEVRDALSGTRFEKFLDEPT